MTTPDPSNIEHLSLARTSPHGWSWFCLGGRLDVTPKVEEGE